MKNSRRLFWSILAALAVVWIALPLAKLVGLPWPWSAVLAPGGLLLVGLLYWWARDERK